MQGQRQHCRCLQMFADVLLAPAAGQVTSEPWPQCQPQLKQETEQVLNFLLDPSPAWLQHGGQGWLGDVGLPQGVPTCVLGGTLGHCL